ncbi:5-formyltetrahydrofolate cyclo-ligase [Mycolicibacterium brumae]|uniref:5-formyltetrahydrofolate cyclo-ligase n=1 Tax=Mycolicibacterium brumae TaxID=85968 RepID=A0A2G5PFZ9_9MYCO|nr:5-formyltetrahydrofolate cyclo-ligase [Mycolicibacterium brumae]MCV7191911.1 5-formyltetrahydrofolate cyclo-ligase [Mycolicibacterium brumae]PIB76874.1 5-formyltetrahydrofolate cyclo-ligase [Mycolicibacterium brumae]RWA20583.1 hypothetical protein MBRU_02685 [Mycolicibacterium brumae DSM 44177]UWW07679.1 5-formyltetrahydrofolate cyclo-ligase [Mycolicibacterium brumae]
MVDEAKQALRARLLATRRAAPRERRAAEAAALGAALFDAIAARPGDTVAGYLPVGAEPGSVELLNRLADAGARVLLPVTALDGDGSPAPLRWGRYRPDDLRPARYGLLEPGDPPSPPEELRTARVVIVPALAVDHAGRRLGRGGGFYDRSLPLRDPAAQLIAVVRDDEFLDEVPAEPHDITVSAVATPGRGVLRLPLK